MQAERVTHELNDPLAQDLLRSATLARLAYNGPDGFPRVIPIGFYWTGDLIVVCTAPISPKVRALTARPEVALTIEPAAAPTKSLMIRGRAEIAIVDGIPPEYLAASAKEMDPEQERQFEAQVRRVYRQMARIAITPTWARAYDFGAGRVPEFLQKLVSEAQG